MRRLSVFIVLCGAALLTIAARADGPRIESSAAATPADHRDLATIEGLADAAPCGESCPDTGDGSEAAHVTPRRCQRGCQECCCQREPVGCFNCRCRGSYKFPVPPLYTYFWPGIYSQKTMTAYVSPWRYPPLAPPETVEDSSGALSRPPAAHPVRVTGAAAKVAAKPRTTPQPEKTAQREWPIKSSK
jgi:hypothetical protein